MDKTQIQEYRGSVLEIEELIAERDLLQKEKAALLAAEELEVLQIGRA